MRILFCGDTFPAAKQFLGRQLNAAQDEILVCPADKIKRLLHGVDVLIPLMCKIDADIMDAGSIRLIQQWGAGIEGVDLSAAAARNIAVANVPATGSNADSVAEHMVFLILAMLRDFPGAQTSLRAGRLGWPLGRTLSKRTVCLFGLGAIAKALARRLRAFDVHLLGLTRNPSQEKTQQFGLTAAYSTLSPEDRKACLAQTDILAICARLSKETLGAIDAITLASLKPGAYLVNAARGAIVEYDALLHALKSGHLAGAALDVFWKEPISPDDPLLALPNLIATPHIGGVTDRSYAEIAASVAANIERLRQAEPLLNCIVP